MQAATKDGLDQRTDSLRFSLFLPLKHHRHLLVSITSFINSVIVNQRFKGEKEKDCIFHISKINKPTTGWGFNLYLENIQVKILIRIKPDKSTQ
jgi:hypothetical protein